MTLRDHAAGMQPFELLRDLRFIKLSPQVRARVLLIEQAFKRGPIDQEDKSYLRQVYNRNIARIRDLKASEEAARISWNKERGLISATDLEAARRATAEREAAEREAAEAARIKKQDVGL